MKTLYLVRHAKSDWNNPNLDDIDRPLNKRGYRDAHFMSEWLAKQDHKADVLVSSPAVRAMTTALIFARSMRYPAGRIDVNPSIYEAGVGDLKTVVEELDDQHDTAMLFGHNPGFTSLAYNYCKNPELTNIPTCGIYVIGFDADSWVDTDCAAAHERFFQFPKNFQ